MIRTGAAELLAELDGALVAVVPVRDEKLGVPQPVRRVSRQPPEPRAVDLEVGGPSREGRGANECLREQEDRLGLHAGLAAAGAAAPRGSADACARAGRTLPVRVRRRRQRDDHAVPLARDAVRADELLDARARPTARRPARGSPSASHSRYRRPPQSADSGKRHMDDVVRAARVQRRALLVGDGVVRRGDEIGERAGRARVADGAKRLDVGHRGERTNGFCAIYVET